MQVVVDFEEFGSESTARTAPRCGEVEAHCTCFSVQFTDLDRLIAVAADEEVTAVG
ncbi:hypothetical protein Scep_017809 [Stephania cephalantha]|uniref:Uncharacterized protein n=1 Tax=Stephania cephalantha TaxID=152367 RepID=A0AAP0IS87_9MAGN